jgi:hypothetical protein
MDGVGTFQAPEVAPALARVLGRQEEDAGDECRIERDLEDAERRAVAGAERLHEGVSPGKTAIGEKRESNSWGHGGSGPDEGRLSAAILPDCSRNEP